MSQEILQKSGRFNKQLKRNANSYGELNFLPPLEHELRTILNAIVGVTELMRQRLDIEPVQATRQTPWREYLDMLGSATHDFATILDELHDYLRVNLGALVFDRRPLDLRPLLDEVAEGFAPKIKARGPGFKLEFTPDILANPPMIVADPLRIRQIISQLLANALKFTASGEIAVTLDYDATKTQVSLTVTDTGIGVAPDKLSQVFDKFVQVYSAVDYGKAYQGLGLGLTLVKYLVEAQGGTIEISSKLAEGTSVEVRFPVTLTTLAGQTLLHDKLILLVDYQSDSGATMMSEQLSLNGFQWEILTLSDATYALMQEKITPVPAVILLAANQFDQQLAYFARAVRSRDIYQNSLLVLALSESKNFAWEKEQALLNHYNAVLKISSGSFFAVDKLLSLWTSWSQRGDKEMAAKKSAKSAKAGTSATGKYKVLVIEDNLINQKVMRLLLGEMDVEAEMACTGATGLEKLLQQDYAAVLVDIGLPDMNGFEVIERLRSGDDASSRLPVVVLTADGHLQDEQDFSVKNRIDDYLVKPVTLEKLYQSLKIFLPNLSLKNLSKAQT